jgi:hypothetical protein
MDTVELFVKTTVDFDLFEKFAEFIVEREPNKNSLASDYYETLKSILKWNTGAGTLQNVLSKARQKTFVFELPMESYKAFCEKFTDSFNKMSPEKQDEYRAIETAFAQWKFNLDRKHNIKYENAFQPIEAISIEAKEETIEKSENGNIEANSSVTHEEFYKAIETISQYYVWNVGFRDVLPYEISLAKMFKHFVRRRTDKYFDIDNLLFSSEKFDKSDFIYTGWKIYELYGEKVICRSLQFSNLPDCHAEVFPGFKGFIQLGQKDSAPQKDFNATFEFNHFHNIIMISSSYERMIYNLHYSPPKKYYDNMHAGHKCMMDDNNIVTFIPAFLVADNLSSKQVPYYSEYDLNSTEIPDNIKARLFGWESLNLFPFMHIHLTACRILGEQKLGFPFYEFGDDI